MLALFLGCEPQSAVSSRAAGFTGLQPAADEPSASSTSQPHSGRLRPIVQPETWLTLQTDYMVDTFFQRRRG